jgi:hypothetical protein
MLNGQPWAFEVKPDTQKAIGEVAQTFNAPSVWIVSPAHPARDRGK